MSQESSYFSNICIVSEGFQYEIHIQDQLQQKQILQLAAANIFPSTNPEWGKLRTSLQYKLETPAETHSKETWQMREFTVTEFDRMGSVWVMCGVTCYRFKKYKTNKTTVISYSDLLLNTSYKASPNPCEHKSFFPIEWKIIKVYITQRNFSLYYLEFYE